MSASTVQRVAVVGTGVIGASWAALFLARGLDVSASDPSPGAEARLRDAVEAAWPALGRLGLVDGASPDRLAFSADVAEAVDGAQFLQENGPERPLLKQELFRDLDALLPADVLLASSSSTLMPSSLQEGCARHPERVLVGHPFNPAHLVPLVEVVGGRQTSPEALDRAVAFYAALGKRPVRLRQELPGHLANRLQAALWREAYSLVERGVASVADVDAAISHGPGLRWALLGPLVNQHLSGGPGGLAHVLAHLGPPTQAIMDDLGAPQLTPELVSALVDGVEDELSGTDQHRLLAQRDALLLQLLAAKSATPDLP
jgi:carnitine 3-dehydrogenase